MPGEQTGGFLDRYLDLEDHVRRMSLRNRQIAVQKTWAMEGDITATRHFPPWVIDHDLNDTDDEMLVLIGVYIACYSGAPTIELWRNETVISRGSSPNYRTAGTYALPNYMSYRSPVPLAEPLVLAAHDTIRPVLRSDTASGTHLSVTAVILHTPGS